MRIALSLILLAGLVVSGCVVAQDRYGNVHVFVPRLHVYDRDDDVRVVTTGVVWTPVASHVHGPNCGHYWNNGRWYYYQGHVHGDGCGHVYHHGYWVAAGAVRVVTGHVHSHNCGHYHHDGHWYYMRGHVHGAGCGHHWDGRVWIAVRW